MTTETQIRVTKDSTVVRFQLAKIVASVPFVRSYRIGEFLTFVVENTLEGQHDVLKETCIGSMVFGREPSYDPKIDPIVRVEARRLRSKLQEYYDTEGLTDGLLITLPKGGYRPVIEVRTVEQPKVIALPDNDAAVYLSTDTPLVATPRSFRRPIYWSLLGLNLLVFAGAAVWFSFQGRAGTRLTRPEPLTSYVGQEFDPAISPDGRHLAFVWDGDGLNYDIYIKSLPSGDTVRLTLDPAHDLHPAWSPDGRDIAFLRVTPSETQVVLMSSSGGRERVLAALRSTVSVWKADASQIVSSVGPSWSPDGSSLVVADNGALFQLSLALEGRRQLTTPPIGSNDFFPSLSPDGRSLAFVRQTSNSTADLYLTSVYSNAAQPLRLTVDRADIRGIAWSPDGRSVVFSSDREGSYALWQVNPAGGRIQPVSTNSTQAISPSLSRKSDMLAYTELTQNTNIWRISTTDATRPLRLISSSHRNNSPQFSPDGQQVAFVSDRSGSWELWVCRADGTAPRQMTHFAGPLLGTPHWSPDGKEIAFDARPGEHSALFVIAESGGSPRQLDHNSFEERMPNWSADGRFLYFNSNRSGTIRLWKRPLSGGEPIQITHRAAYDSFETDGGRTVYFRSDGPGIWSIPSNGGAESFIPALASVEPSRYLAITGRALYFVDQETAPRHIKTYNLATGKISILGEIALPLVSGTPSFTVSPDERNILYAQQDESCSDILAIPWASHR